MQPEILEYIKTQRICVLAVEMLDGAPHAATVHFSHTDNPLTLYFETSRTTRKCEPLFGREKSRATVVIGSNEALMKTLQMDGTVSLIQSEADRKLYLEKFPEKLQKTSDPTTAFFSFTPSWWRFTDWTAPEGKKILTSTD